MMYPEEAQRGGVSDIESREGRLIVVVVKCRRWWVLCRSPSLRDIFLVLIRQLFLPSLSSCAGRSQRFR